MSDYYTHFSVTLPVPENQELAARIPEWIKTHLQIKDMMQEGAGEIWDYEDIDEEGYGCDFMCYANYPGSQAQPIPTVWVSSEDDGNVDSATTLIQRYLDDFEIEGGVLMNYAYTCSKPRVNEAGGGAIVITRDDMIFISAESLALKEASEAGVEILNY